MKDILYRYYGIHVIGIIHLTKRVIKIKTYSKFYVVKIIDDNHIENIFQNIDTLNISYFVKVITNNNNQYLTPYNDQYIYLMPYLDNEEHIAKEMKMKYYLSFISHIHLLTSYTIKINQKDRQQLYNHLSNMIAEKRTYYQQLIENFEKIQWRSPSQWFFMMNYHKIYESFYHAKQYLNEYQEYTKNMTNIRVTLNYHNFSFSHILLKNKCLISIDHIETHIPVFDLYDIYQKENFSLFNNNCINDHYLNINTLNDDEIILLKCLLNIIPTIDFNHNEIDNIINLSQLFNTIEAVVYFIHQI